MITRLSAQRGFLPSPLLSRAGIESGLSETCLTVILYSRSPSGADLTATAGGTTSTENWMPWPTSRDGRPVSPHTSAPFPLAAAGQAFLPRLAQGDNRRPLSIDQP